MKRVDVKSALLMIRHVPGKGPAKHFIHLSGSVGRRMIPTVTKGKHSEVGASSGPLAADLYRSELPQLAEVASQGGNHSFAEIATVELPHRPSNAFFLLFC